MDTWQLIHTAGGGMPWRCAVRQRPTTNPHGLALEKAHFSHGRTRSSGKARKRIVGSAGLATRSLNGLGDRIFSVQPVGLPVRTAQM